LFAHKLLKLYSIRILSLLISILSYTIVIPSLSSNKGLFGIYTVVLSLLIFIQFADLGFLGAGQKYASECFARGEKKEEIKILSFVHFILFIVVFLYSFFLLIFYFKPHLIFKNINEIDKSIAQSLIFILIIFSPVIVLQRFSSAIFAIRIEDYIGQFVDLIGSIAKIISTFYFFKNGSYNIVGYLFFFQIINLLSVLINIFIIKFRYDFQFLMAAKYFRFNSEVFNLTKKMALASILVTFSWILYYELDPLYVSLLYDSNIVAVFAIGLTMLTFSRSIMNAFFSPFQIKFNHLRGINDEKNLSKLFLKLIEWSFPLSVYPTIVIIFLMEPLIISWLGFKYTESIIISRVLIFSLSFSFLSIPISYLANAREKFKLIYINSISLPFFYIIFNFIFKDMSNHLGLPVSKILTLFVNIFINFFFIKQLVSESIFTLLFNILKQSLIPLIVLFLLIFLFKPFWNVYNEKDLYTFFKIVFLGFIICFFPFLIYYFSNKKRNFLLNL
jgi:O-antigen/teichoic acid export membrane protein